MIKIEDSRQPYKASIPWLELICGSISFVCFLSLIVCQFFFVSEYDPHAVAYMIASSLSIFAGSIIAALSIRFGRAGLRQEKEANGSASRRNTVFSMIGIVSGVLHIAFVVGSFIYLTFTAR